MKQDKQSNKLLESYLHENEEIRWSAQPFYNGRWRTLVLPGCQMIISIIIILIIMLATDWFQARPLSWNLPLGTALLIFLAFVRFRQQYFAISTQRLLILSRYLGIWKRLEAIPLEELPDFRIKPGRDTYSRFHFEPIEASYPHYRLLKNAELVAGLRNEDAQAAYELLMGKEG
jgi:hypothetical protein